MEKDVVKYLAWIPEREPEEEGVLYNDGPGLAAEDHARNCYYSDDCPGQRIVHVKRIASDEVLAFDVWVEHDPTFHSSLRRARV